jgi:phage tail sheath gpL-like
MGYSIPGFSGAWLLPMFGIQLNFATGPNLAPGNFAVLLMGNRTASGNLVQDTEIRQCFSRADFIAAAGEGSELELMALAAIQAAPNVSLYLMAVTPAAGGTAATVTVTLSASATSAGTHVIYINGVAINTSYASGATLAAIGAAIAANINAAHDCPFTAAYATNVVTLTSKGVGVRQQDWIIYQDVTNAGGVGYAIAGSSTVNSVGNVTGVRAGATGGTGTDTIVTALTNITKQRWARIACASNDTTNAPLLKATMAAQAAVTIQMYDQACFGFNGTQANATTLSQTTLNDPRSSVFAMRNSETHPALIAAGFASARAAKEALVTGQPQQGNQIGYVDYDNYNCSAWIAPQRFASDAWLASESNALLNAGCSPVSTVNGVAYLQRGVVSYCLNGSQQDTRCLDLGDAVIPDQFCIVLQNAYQTFRQQNPGVQDNPNLANGDPYPVDGIAYPLLWDRAKRVVLGNFRDSGLIKDTFSGANPEYPIASTFDPVAVRIAGATTIVPVRVQHTISEIVNQAAA